MKWVEQDTTPTPIRPGGMLYDVCPEWRLYDETGREVGMVVEISGEYHWEASTVGLRLIGEGVEWTRDEAMAAVERTLAPYYAGWAS